MIDVLAARFWAKVDRSGDCWLWTSAVGTDGYGVFYVGHAKDRERLCLNGKNARAHRVAWVLSGNAPPLPPLVLMHSCDVRLCVNPGHLSSGSVQDNTRDAYRKNRHPGQRLDAATVVYIREQYASGVTGNALAASLGVSRAAIYQAATGHRHRDDSGPRVRHERGR
jgi:hypothetical protein